MKWRQSFEKARNIEASVLKKKGSEAQRRAASVGVRSKTVCKGMKSDAEEGVAKGCKWRKMEENCENTINAIKMEEKMNGKLRKTKEIEETVWKMRKLQEGNSGKTVGTQEKV